MGTHRRPPAEPEDAYEEPPPAPPGPASSRGRTRAEKKAERLAKTERAVAEYARKDAERAARRAARRGEAPPQPNPLPGEAPAAGDVRPAKVEEPPAEEPRAKERKVKEPKVKQPKAAPPPRPRDPRRRRRRVVLTSVSALGIAAAVGGGLAVANFAESAPGEATVLPPAAVMSVAATKQLTSVPAAVLDKVGQGSAVTLLGRVDAPPLRSGKKLRLLYIGAESCPLCAAERWSLVVALSRFGKWGNLGVIHSPKEELFPDTPTLSFHGATYTSKYLVFSGFETTSRVRTGTTYAALDAVPAADQATMRQLRAAPYVPEEATGRLPFVDLGGKFVGAGSHIRAPFIPYFATRTHDEIAAALSDPQSAVGKAVNGGANAWTAAICQSLPKKTRPVAVCSSAAAKAGKNLLRTP